MTQPKHTPHTPGDLDWQSVSANASGGFHLYLIDANGRKIAALWGGAEEKQANAERITLAWNCHDELVAALTAADNALRRCSYNGPERDDIAVALARAERSR